MRVLVMESDRNSAEDAARHLAEMGHDVVRCHEGRTPPFPCNALVENRGCPLDQDPVDVALVVRRHPWPRPTISEQGVSCVIRDNLPLVVAGHVALNPYEDWASVVAGPHDDVVSACERAVAHAMTKREHAATSALHQVLEHHGFDPSSSSVRVERRDDGLRAMIDCPPAIPKEVVSMAATRVVQALRDREPGVRKLDVIAS